MLKPNVIQLIKDSRSCKLRLQLALDNISVPTINKYLDGNNLILTSVPALAVIREELGLSDDEILEPQSATA